MISIFFDPNRDNAPGIPRQSLEFGDFISDVIYAASFLPENAPKVKCRRNRCKGTLDIGHDDENNITYECTHCDKSSGLIVKNSGKR